MDRKDSPRRHFLRQVSVSVGGVCLSACGGENSVDAAGQLSGSGLGAQTPPAQTPPSSGSDASGNPQPVAPATPPATPLEPVPSSGSAQFFLSSAAGVSEAAFCLGQAFVRGEIAAGSDVVASLNELQVSIKNRWPDGSARFAIVAGKVSLAAGQTLAVSLKPGVAVGGSSLSEADLAASGAAAKLSFAGEGSVSLAELIGKQAQRNASTGAWSGGLVRQWVAGPQMSSWVYFAPLGSSSHLSAWFEVRLWAGGGLQILPWIENGRLMLAGPRSFKGELKFEFKGAERFKQSIELPHHSRCMAQNGAGLGYSSGAAATDLAFTHDTAYLQKTRVVPSYFGNTPSSSPRLSQLPNQYTPLGRASYPETMGSTGYDPSIGLLPEWDVFYLSSRGDARALQAVIVNGLSAGRYALHYRDERTNLPLKFSEYPNIALGNNASVYANGGSSTGHKTPDCSGPGAAMWASSHHPSVGYFAYLLTGAHYFVEQIQFAATLNYLKQDDRYRAGSQGVFLTDVGANITRGAAWALRTLVQALSATPDDSPLRAELLASVEANIEYYHQSYVLKPSHPLGFCRPYQDYTSGDGKYMHATWMEDFLTASFGHMIELDLPLTSAARGKLSEFFAWKARSVVGRLGAAGDAQAYAFVDAAAYTLPVAPADSVDWLGGTGPWYASWGQLYQAASGAANSDASLNALRGAYYPAATSYWGNLMPAIAYAVEHGVPGAQQAFARLTNASNWYQIVEGWREDPVWGVRPRQVVSSVGVLPTPLTPVSEDPPQPSAGSTKLDEAMMPAWRQGQAIGQWREIAGSSQKLLAVGAGLPGNTGPRARIDAWCGLAADTRDSTLYAAALGGHADYAGNEVLSIQLNSAAPAWVLRRPPSAAEQIKSNVTHYGDGRPTSRHSYFGHQFVEQRNRAMHFYIGSRFGDGYGAAGVDGFDPTANDWDPANTYPKPLGNGNVIGSALALDPSTGDAYWFPSGGNEVQRWKQSSNSWSRVASLANFSGYYVASAFDTQRRRILLLGGAVGPQGALFTVESASLSTPTFSGTAAAELKAIAPKDGAALGLVYVPQLDAYVLRGVGAGAALYLIQASNFAVTRLSGLGGEAIPEAAWGVYTRLQYLPQLGGVALYPHYDSNIWFLRLL